MKVEERVVNTFERAELICIFEHLNDVGSSGVLYEKTRKKNRAVFTVYVS